MRTRDRIRLKRYRRHAEGYLELGLHQQAIDTLRRLGELIAADAHALFLLGDALRSLERYEEAIPPLERACRGDPENIHVRLALAWCHKRTQQLPLAIDDIEQALAIEPRDALLHYNLACYLSLARNKDRAIFHLSKALRLDGHYRDLIDRESDFDPIRADPDFQALTKAVV